MYFFFFFKVSALIILICGVGNLYRAEGNHSRGQSSGVDVVGEWVLVLG